MHPDPLTLSHSAPMDEGLESSMNNVQRGAGAGSWLSGCLNPLWLLLSALEVGFLVVNLQHEDLS